MRWIYNNVFMNPRKKRCKYSRSVFSVAFIKWFLTWRFWFLLGTRLVHRAHFRNACQEKHLILFTQLICPSNVSQLNEDLLNNIRSIDPSVSTWCVNGIFQRIFFLESDLNIEFFVDWIDWWVIWIEWFKVLFDLSDLSMFGFRWSWVRISEKNIYLIFVFTPPRFFFTPNIKNH